MNTVAHYIKQTLFNHNCVIIPDFGGFLSDYKSAVINPISHEFAPPISELSFNSSLHKDDGLLKSEISRGEEIDILDAEELIKEFVAELKERIEEQENYRIDGLGVFSLRDEKIVYSPEKIENLNADTFGLPNFTIHPIERNTEDMKRVRPVPPARRVVKRRPSDASSEAKKTAENAKESVSSSVSDLKEAVNKEDVEVNNRKPLYAILPLFLLLLAGGITGYIFYKKNNAPASQLASTENVADDVKTNSAGLVTTSDSEGVSTSSENASSLSSDENSSISTNEATETSTSTPVTESDESNETTGSNATSNVLPETSSESAKTMDNNTASTGVSNIGSGYNIIIGSFSVPSNARKVMNRTSGSGIVKYNGLNCVSVGTYSSRQEALNALSSYSSQHPGAWVANIR